MDIKIITVCGYFGQSLPTDVSLDTGKLIQCLQLKKHTVSTIDIQDLQSKGIDSHSYYIVGSHQNPDIKKYIDDTINILFYGDNEKYLIPNKYNVLAHENKGVQALLANKIGKEYFPQQDYFFRPVDISQTIVAKKTDGAGSSGVELVKNNENLKRVLNQFSRYDLTLGYVIFSIKTLLKKYIFKNKYSESFNTYHKKYTRYCLQEFYSGLTCDYKVLAFGSTVYVLQRDVRNGSFKASGSGKFTYPDAENELLEFCDTLRKKIGTPYVSLDVVKLRNGEFKCIEFQCVHFGPYTQLNAKTKYVRLGEGLWQAESNNLSLEEVYAQALNEYLINSFE